MKTNVDILLATYNGSKYLPELLDSILQQDFQDYRLLVHDDGSNDNTMEVLNMYEARFLGKMGLINDGLKFGSAKDNFAHLMRLSTSPYIAFCDQDDVWLPNKLSSLASAMKTLEHGETDVPCLVFSDLRVVDKSLNVIHQSFWVYERINVTRLNSMTLLSRNTVTGCAMLVNAMTLRMALPIPNDAVMHDWWLALIATNGRISHIDTQLILYRQHQDNDTGAKDRRFISQLIKLLFTAKITINRIIKLGESTELQAIAYRDKLKSFDADASQVNAYLDYRHTNFVNRLLKRKIYLPGDWSTDLARIIFWR